MKTAADRLLSKQREYEAQMMHRKHVQAFIDKFRYNANRAALVQSKIKALERLPELKPVQKEVPVVLRFPEPETLFPPLLQLDAVCFSYGPGERTILSNVDLSASMQSRICIVGDNGAGKNDIFH